MAFAETCAVVENVMTMFSAIVCAVHGMSVPMFVKVDAVV